jgi:hypothetical protein
VTESAPRTDRGSRIQLWAIILVTLVTMALGVLVVVAPEHMGVPEPPATVIATPVTTVSP